MRQRIFSTFCIVFIISCRTSKLPHFDYNNGPNPWINAFKDNVFFSCLSQSYPPETRDSIFRMISKHDLFNPYEEFMGYKVEKKVFLDSLGAAIPKNLPAFWHIDEQQDKGKNVYLSTCLHYYISRELDSIARLEYEKYIRLQKKTGL